MRARRRKPYVVGASPWMAGSSPAMTNVNSEQVARLLRFARNDGGDVVVKRPTPSLRGARSATKQSLPHGRRRLAAPGTATFWRNEPENADARLRRAWRRTHFDLLRLQDH